MTKLLVDGIRIPVKYGDGEALAAVQADHARVLRLLDTMQP